MVDSLAVLAKEMEYLRIAQANENRHLKEAIETNAEETRLLKEKCAKAEKYGWFCMGVIFVGITIASSIETAIKFIKSPLP